MTMSKYSAFSSTPAGSKRKDSVYFEDKLTTSGPMSLDCVSVQ